MGVVIPRNGYRYDRTVDVVDGDGNRRRFSSVEAYEASRAGELRSDPTAYSRHLDDDRRAEQYVRDRIRRNLLRDV